MAEDRSKVLSFRAPEQSRDLIEHHAKNNGQSISNYLLYSSIDEAMNFEWNRAVSILTDFSTIAAGRFEALGKEAYTPEEITEVLLELNRVYVQQRLQAFLTHIKRHCKVAIDSYLNDYIDDYSGAGAAEAFIINNCIVKIYDSLKQAGIISDEEHEEKTRFYDAFMITDGKELLQPERKVSRP